MSATFPPHPPVQGVRPEVHHPEPPHDPHVQGEICAKTSKEKFGQKKGEFEDWNRTFVQMVMGRGFMKKVHCIELSEPDPPTFKDSSTRCIEASLFYTLEALN